MSQITVQTQLPFEQLIQTVEQLDASELEQLIAQAIRVQTKRKTLSLPKDQSLLLQQITQCIPNQLQERYDLLIGKRQDNALTDEEYQELINLGEHIEAIDVKRLENLTKLAKLRQISLNELIQDFQLQPQAL
ncbi:STAS/SEC14 domain-containing protein [Pseudanabaena sp. UWO311]|uniref:STAS/SEC14 domain-containing protein n=1 Tax=Pseudanabaena sp. UWO311 TaxID=2487337 RepID=UPI00115C1DA4|nr:STAS/SEC14 domain-containing protein [Pseudanabaena sp. UWO311]TYQ28301.1 STAS/SEC14 domain-containing protein [Pseudanabaena sp. UWO311]